MISAFGVEHLEVSKAAWRGEPGQWGDRRNTKAVAATAGGAGLGGLVGAHLGALTANTSQHRSVPAPAAAKVPTKAQVRHAAARSARSAKSRGPLLEGVAGARDLSREIRTGSVAAVRAVPGGARMISGAKYGLGAGAVTGAAAFGAARRRRARNSA